MIRSSTLNLDYATGQKKEKLDWLFDCYSELVNFFIDHLWESGSNDKFLAKTISAETPLSARMQQCAYKQAKAIVDSQRNNKKKKKFKPCFNGSAIELDSRFVEIQESSNAKEFDIWVRFSSLGERVIILVPTKKHKHFNKFIEAGWHLKKSARLRKTKKGVYVLDVFFEKETPEPKQTGLQIGIDIGINKLLSLSDGTQFGDRIKDLLNKLNRKQRESKAWFRCLVEIKNYIGEQVNQIPFKDCALVVAENIKNISKNTKKEHRVNKTTRKLLGYWNYRLLIDRIRLACEVNRVHFKQVDPSYTSQTCRQCGHKSRGNRSGEAFKCCECGYTGNADIFAALNILERYTAGAYSPC